MVAAAAVLAAPVSGVEPGDPDEASPAEVAGEEDRGPAADEKPSEGESTEGESAEDHSCSLAWDVTQSRWVDRMQERVMETVCSATEWFDGYFGDPNQVDDYHTSFGRAGLALVYDELDELELDSLFRARIELPNLERKVSAFVGRFEEDEFVKDREDSFTSLPPVFADTEGQEWLAGLGYRPPGRRGSRFDLDAGIRLGFPMDPFVRGRWRAQRILGEEVLLRFRETVFWRNRLGFGTTTQLDLERMIFSSSLLARWRSEATMAEKVEGVDWKTTVTVYQEVGKIGALAYEALWDGETDAPITVEEAGLRVIFRHRFLRDWFFLEYRLRSRWVKETPADPRVHSFGMAFGFEMLFGRDVRDTSGP